MKVGPPPVEDVRVRLPDLPQHDDAQSQVVAGAARESQPAVDPRLAEVAVHGVALQLIFKEIDNYIFGGISVFETSIIEII